MKRLSFLLALVFLMGCLAGCGSTAPGAETAPAVEEAAETAAKACREHILGSTEDVLFETETGGISDGLTGGYFRVYTDAPVKLGEIAPIRLIRLHQDGFWGEMC